MSDGCKKEIKLGVKQEYIMLQFPMLELDINKKYQNISKIFLSHYGCISMEEDEPTGADNEFSDEFYGDYEDKIEENLQMEGKKKERKRRIREVNVKSSSLTFVAGVMSLIAFSMFLYAFPSGIDVAPVHSILHEGEFAFYGAIYGNGNIELYGENCTLYVENGTFNVDEVKIVGVALYNISYAYYNSSGARFHEIFLKGNVTIMSREIYYSGYVNGKINGNMSARFGGEIEMKGAKYVDSYVYEEKPFLKIVPVAMDKIFILEDGYTEIEGTSINASKLYTRGEGKLMGEGLSIKSHIEFVDSKFYTTEKSFYIIPYKIIFIWIAAIIIFIASLFVKGGQRDMDKKLYGTSVILGIFFFAISLFLWIKQAEVIFGKSIALSLTLSSIVTITFFLLPYIVAVAIIGFPIKTAITSAMSMLGMTNLGKAIGRPAGFIASFWLGIVLLPCILNMIIVPFIRLFSG